MFAARPFANFGPRSATRARRGGAGLVWGLLLLAPMLGGCASLSNPVAHGIPVCRLPEQFKGKPRADQITLPLNLLEKPREEAFRIRRGAILGVFIEGVLGEPKQPVPVQIDASGGRLPPSLGYPVVVREDGRISLPYTKPIDVDGLTVAEAEDKIRRVLIEEEKIITDKNRVIVTLQRENHNRVTVIRQDAGGVTFGQGLTNTKRGTGFPLELPESESDVLTALTRTGGMPGIDARNEVYILRGLKPGEKPVDPTVMPDFRKILGDPTGKLAEELGVNVTRIPLRLRPGDAIPFTRADIALNNGDIVFIETREAEVFYVGGILPPGEYPIPQYYDLDVITAIALVRGPLFNGALGGNNFTGQFISAGIGQPSPTNLTVIRRIQGAGEIRIRVDLAKAARDPRERIIVLPGDTLILQETFGEAVARYFTSQFTVGYFSNILNSSTSNIAFSGRTP
ncbi:MAG TPA: polysaccharide biosynthesis/export family protein [Gemmatales bacterium]|nr:polysaccharide biosynthesis/export family protein [Gemmatales bacterium]HMP58678.1 polysaccharide biosynthesis/export family protein [Gemmatales bacterium]